MDQFDVAVRFYNHGDRHFRMNLVVHFDEGTPEPEQRRQIEEAMGMARDEIAKGEYGPVSSVNLGILTGQAFIYMHNVQPDPTRTGDGADEEEDEPTAIYEVRLPSFDLALAPPQA